MTNRSRRGLIAILALSMVWALPLWLVTFPPMTDYPQHLAMASIVRFFSDPVHNLAGTYQVAPLHPNTAFELLVASIAGLVPGIGPIYDATKHAVVAISEDLYQDMNMAGLPIGVSVLCPGWVRTSVVQADRNWPEKLGEVPPWAEGAEVLVPYVQRAVDEGMEPAAVADLVADAITANRFWVFTDPRFTQIALDRWQRIAEGHNPQTEVDAPGMPPAKQLVAEIRRLLAGQGGALWLAGGPGPRRDGTTWSRMTTEAAKAPG